MLTKTEKKFSLVFILIVILHLLLSDSSNPTLLFFITNSTYLPYKIRLVTAFALVFSLIGDILLMFVNIYSSFFIAGLVSFLIAHILYIIVFSKTRNKNKKPTIILILLTVYALGIFYFLSDGLENMLIPVILYMTIILTMVTMAFLRQGSVNNISYKLVAIGAILFVISDSLLALNKFYVPFYFADISIIFTYGLAQLFIVLGLKKQS
ncbi:MAG: lysoplasmalogenase [Flavobacteriaceae bacterium]